MLLITSGASLLWNMLAGKGVIRAELSYPVTNFRIQSIIFVWGASKFKEQI